MTDPSATDPLLLLLPCQSACPVCLTSYMSPEPALSSLFLLPLVTFRLQNRSLDSWSRLPPYALSHPLTAILHPVTRHRCDLVTALLTNIGCCLLMTGFASCKCARAQTHTHTHTHTHAYTHTYTHQPARLITGPSFTRYSYLQSALQASTISITWEPVRNHNL